LEPLSYKECPEICPNCGNEICPDCGKSLNDMYRDPTSTFCCFTPKNVCVCGWQHCDDCSITDDPPEF
jgi:hypothetical protein